MQNTKKLVNYITVALLVIFPVVILNVNHGGSTTFVILALLGIITPFIKRYRPFSHNEKRLFIVLGLYFTVFLISLIFNGISKEGVRKIELCGKFLLAIPFLYLLLRFRLKEKLFWYGINLGAIAAGLFGIYEFYINVESPHYRIHGATHQIIFGDLSIAMAFMSVSGIEYFRGEKKWLILMPIGAFLLGLIASILTGTRGAWIAIPALTVLLIWFYWNNMTQKQRIATVSVVLFFPLLLYIIPQSGVKTRLDLTYEGIKNYQTTEGKTSSTGQRFEMWKISWRIFLENPIIGVGPGMYHIEAQEVIKKKKIHEIVAPYKHPHNEYLNVLTTRGLFGLLALLALFLIPGRNFFYAMKNNNKDISIMGLTGMILIVSYMHFALTEAIFERSPLVLFYTFYLAHITYLISMLSHQESNTN